MPGDPSAQPRREAVRIEGLSKVFPDGTQALDQVDLTVYEGEFLAVLGLSGSGKSTLLRCINRLIEPTEGRILIHGEDVTAASGRALRRLRSDVAMIFQQFNLVRRHSVLSNVLSGSLGRAGLLSSLFVRFSESERQKALGFLQRVGLEGRDHSRADALSGGQQQRVAIARALMQEARLVLADEPVASLDPALRHSVMRHIEALNHEGMTVMCALHDIDLVRRYATRLVALRGGRLVWAGTAEQFDDATFRDIYGHDAEPSAGSTLPVAAPASTQEAVQ